MDEIDPKARKNAKASACLYGLIEPCMFLFGAWMTWTYISGDHGRHGVVTHGMAALLLSGFAVAASGLVTAYQYWRDGGRGTLEKQLINWRSANMAFVAMTFASLAYSIYPFPLPTRADEIAGAMTDIAVDGDTDVTKLDFRVAGRQFAFDCRRSDDCKRADILELAKSHPRRATVIPIGNTLLSLVVDGQTIVDPAQERRRMLGIALIWLIVALQLALVAYGDWRGWPLFRKPLKTRAA